MDPSQELFTRPSNFHKPTLPQTDVTVSDSGTFTATMEMMQVINAQNVLIMKLLNQQNILYQQLAVKNSGSDSSSNSMGKKNEPNKVSGYKEIGDKRFSSSSSSNPEENEQFKPHVNIVQGQSHRKKMVFQQSRHFKDESVNSQEEMEQFYESRVDSKCLEKKKQTETKNMIKNFGKAIFNYIRKHKNKMREVITKLGLSQQQFMLEIEKNKGRVHSIAELRTLWTKQGLLGKAFRILSQQYLRRHCLAKTFNSRIENYSLHLKYRQRLLQGLQNPQDFTVLKTN